MCDAEFGHEDGFLNSSYRVGGTYNLERKTAFVYTLVADRGCGGLAGVSLRSLFLCRGLYNHTSPPKDRSAWLHY